MNEFIMQETEEMTTFGSVWKRYAPVAELVRCKDCKYGEKVPMFKYYPDVTLCNKHIASHNDDWFCADGERKTDESISNQ